jgi:hypothetical protein
MVEDMGAAAPRFEMALMLGVDERDVPTEAVHYDLPHGLWMPALLGEREDAPGAVMWEGGRIFVWGDGMAERRDVTLELSDEEACEDTAAMYLAGRSKVKVRPTPAFYRPGVVVVAERSLATRMDAAKRGGLLGVVGAFDPRDGRYLIHWQVLAPDGNDEEEAEAGAPHPLPSLRLTPYEVQAWALLPDAELRCNVGCIREYRVELQRADGSTGVFGEHRAVTADPDDDDRDKAAAVCFLDYQGGEEEGNDSHGEADQLQPGCIGVRMARFVPASSERGGGLFGASHGARVRKDYEERYATRTRVHIDGVALPPPSTSASVENEPAAEGNADFVRCRHIAAAAQARQ